MALQCSRESSVAHLTQMFEEVCSISNGGDLLQPEILRPWEEHVRRGTNSKPGRAILFNKHPLLASCPPPGGTWRPPRIPLGRLPPLNPPQGKYLYPYPPHFESPSPSLIPLSVSLALSLSLFLLSLLFSPSAPFCAPVQYDGNLDIEIDEENSKLDLSVHDKIMDRLL